MAFDLRDFPEVFAVPARMTPHSAWLYHLPMAPVIVKLLRPRTFVELGTHAGDSYLAFCNAVKSASVRTQCVAIDSWKGDAHSLAYGPEILASLRTVHDPVFGGFSRLMQADFDGAVGSFDAGTIDLLHIDGAHDYASVRHDFETWLPKLSDRSVVLFHDTAERAADFGVWRLWDEVRAARPHASVPYGHGLGILAVGDRVPAEFLEFLDALNSDAFLSRFFEALGHRLYVIVANFMGANSLHDCQIIANEWRQRTGQAIRHPTPNLPLAVGGPAAFGYGATQDVHQMGLDAVTLMNEVAGLRQKVNAPR